MNGNFQDADVRDRMDKRYVERALNKENIRRKRHLMTLGVLVTLILCGLFVRVFYIKYVYGSEYERRAVEQELAKQESAILPIRGTIKDRNNQTLVISHSVDNIILDVRYLVKEKQSVQEKTLSALNTHLGIPMSTLESYLAKNPDGSLVYDTNYLIIARGITKNISNGLFETGVKCIYPDDDSKRTYIHNTLASQVLGFVRGAGSWGLENKYDAELAGTPGRMFTTLENTNSVSNQIPAQDGYTLVTTLDMNIQKIAENAVKGASALYEAQNTSVIVMNPKTGEVLAMADNNGFDANQPSNIEAFTDLRMKTEMAEMNDEDLLEALYKTWGNYNISESLEPGSIFKPLIVAAALEENLVSADSPYFCGGHKIVQGRKIGCWISKYPAAQHGNITLEEGLAQSCNVMMMDIGDLLGKEKFYKYQHDFGFGEKTGIDLPGEMITSSLLHSLSTLDASDLAAGSMGQGFNVTPIQAINAFSALINGGNLMTPYVVSHIFDSNGNLIKETTPKIQRRVISQSTSYYMRNVLKRVVDDPNGTGKKARIDGYSIGGKTGTAQQNRGEAEEELAQLFIAYLPAENPEIIALAIIYKPKDYQEGSTSAAPMLREVLSEIIKYRGMQPTAGDINATASTPSGNEISLDNYVGKNTVDATKLINKTGLNYEFIGSGDIIENQHPPAGSKIARDGMVWLYLKSSGPEAGLVIIPDVRKSDVDRAVELLTAAGFVCIVEEDNSEAAVENTQAGSSEDNASEEGSTEVLKYVTQVYPSPGTKVAPGTEIKIKAK